MDDVTLIFLFTSWQFYVGAMAVVAGVSTLKLSIPTELLKTRRMKALLQLTTIVLGGLLGLIPSFFPGELLDRVLIGVVAGFSSEWVYRLVKKRMGAVVEGYLSAKEYK